MKKELLDKWCVALRSGEYPQTCGALRNKDGYCCLGVFLDVVDPEGWLDGDPLRIGGDLHRLGNENELLAATCHPLGLSLYHERELIDRNDTRGDSFVEIADYIEANIPVTP